MSHGSMTVYLAGPMRSIELYNFPAFDRYAAELRRRGFTVISPAEMDRAHGFDPAEPIKPTIENLFLRDAMVRDLTAICRRCDGIALLPGWEKSAGVRVEVELGRCLGLRFLDATTGQDITEKVR